MNALRWIPCLCAVVEPAEECRPRDGARTWPSLRLASLDSDHNTAPVPELNLTPIVGEHIPCSAGVEMQPDQGARRRRFEEPGHARFLTFSCYHRLALLDNSAIRDLFSRRLDESRSQLGFRLIAWVVMPNHIHLLLLPQLPKHPVPAILRALKEPFARDVIARWRQLDAPVLSRLVDGRGHARFWQRGGGYDRNIYTDEVLLKTIEYMHANPVRRGLVPTPIDWVWSSARWYAGMTDGPVTMDPLY